MPAETGQDSLIEDPREPGKAGKTTKLGAALWIACCQFFLAEQVVRRHVRGPYSMALDTISSLGALHPFGARAAQPTSTSPLHGLMNSSFLLQGVLILLGALLVRRHFAGGLLLAATFLLFEAAGAGVFLVGLVPEDAGSPLHVLGAAGHFVCGGLAMLLLGVWLLRQKQRSEFGGTFSILAGTMALTATLSLGIGLASGWAPVEWHMGAVERMAAYPLPAWLTIAGFVLLVRVSQQNV